jgi:hypothetical protein
VPGDIFETDLPITPDRVPRYARHIARGLVGEARQGCAFRLCLNDAAQGSANEKGIVDRARGRRELAHGHTESRAEVHLFARLHQSAGLDQLAVDRHSRAIFEMENRLPHASGASVMRRAPPQPTSDNFNDSDSDQWLRRPECGEIRLP